jgi:hypothetical protein
VRVNETKEDRTEFVESGGELVEMIIIDLDGEAIKLNNIRRRIRRRGRERRGDVRMDNRAETGGEFRFKTGMRIGELSTTIEMGVEIVDETVSVE